MPWPQFRTLQEETFLEPLDVGHREEPAVHAEIKMVRRVLKDANGNVDIVDSYRAIDDLSVGKVDPVRTSTRRKHQIGILRLQRWDLRRINGLLHVSPVCAGVEKAGADMAPRQAKDESEREGDR